MHGYTLLRPTQKNKTQLLHSSVMVDIKSKLEIIYLKILMKKQQLWTTGRADMQLPNHRINLTLKFIFRSKALSLINS